jgi:hypothetical protein
LPQIEQSRKNDPNVKLPAAVQKSADRANQLAEGKVSPTNGATVVTDFDPKNPRPPTEVVHTLPTPVPTPAPPPASAASSTPPAPEPVHQEQDLEQKFKSAQGRLEREANENRRLAAQVADLNRLLASVNTPPSVQDSGVRFNSGQTAPLKRLTDAELKEFGPEFVDVVGRRAEEAVSPYIAQLVGEINALKQQVGGVSQSVRQNQALTAQDRAMQILEHELPGAYEKLNWDPNFARWLDTPDELSGVMRRQLLSDAHARGEGHRLASIFRSFINYEASSRPVQDGGQQPGNGADTTASTPRLDLASLAAPGRAKSGQTNLPPEKPIFTRADIATFYKEKTLGKYAGREQEANDIEQAIILAGRENRVR